MSAFMFGSLLNPCVAAFVCFAFFLCNWVRSCFKVNSMTNLDASTRKTSSDLTILSVGTSYFVCFHIFADGDCTNCQIWQKSSTFSELLVDRPCFYWILIGSSVCTTLIVVLRLSWVCSPVMLLFLFPLLCIRHSSVYCQLMHLMPFMIECHAISGLPWLCNAENCGKCGNNVWADSVMWIMHYSGISNHST